MKRGLRCTSTCTSGASVRLVDFDPDGEERVVAHALWPASGRDLAEVRARVAERTPERLFPAYARTRPHPTGRELLPAVSRRVQRRGPPTGGCAACGAGFDVEKKAMGRTLLLGRIYPPG